MAFYTMNIMDSSLDAAFIGGVGICDSISDSKLLAIDISRRAIVFRLF